MPSPNFEFPVYKAVEEEDEEIPNEIRQLLDQERKVIQPHEEDVEIINLSSDEEKKEVKGRVIGLLREYVDIFAWSYRDMAGLDQGSYSSSYGSQDQGRSTKAD
jgi:hypothetical protein